MTNPLNRQSVCSARLVHPPLTTDGLLVDHIGQRVRAIRDCVGERLAGGVACGGKPIGDHVLLLRRVVWMETAHCAILEAACPAWSARVARDHRSNATGPTRLRRCSMQKEAHAADAASMDNFLKPSRSADVSWGRNGDLYWAVVV